MTTLETTTLSTSLQPASRDWPTDAVPEASIDWLFARMAAFYGARFADMWRGADHDGVRRTWGRELATLTRDELRAGCTNLRTRIFPPTLPEFIALCRPALNVDAALYEAIEQMRQRDYGKDQWSHPAIFWAAVTIGAHDLRSLGFSELRPRFERVLREFERRTDLDPVSPRPPSLPEPAARVESADAEVYFAQLRVICAACLNRKPGKEWAEKIVAAAEAGRKIHPNKLAIAKAALGSA